MSANSQHLAKQLKDRARAQRMAGKPTYELLERAAAELEYLASRCIALEDALKKARGY